MIIVAACTTAWDQAHGVVSAMGDRFVLIRSNSCAGPLTAGTIRNTGCETQIRRELSEAVVVVRCQPIHARCSFSLEGEKRLPE
jgi:hypothetical protein